MFEKAPGTESGDHDNEKNRRHSILAILQDDTLSPLQRRRSIQDLMDGRPNVRTPDGQGNDSSADASTPRTTARDMEQSRPPCSHYERNCSIVCPYCGRVYGCRICHDEDMELCKVKNAESVTTDSIAETNTNPSNHKIDRFSIQEIICRLCFTRQSSKSNQCVYCQVTFAEYHCSFCNLWMSREQNPFHCPDCRCCRIRGRNNSAYQHCYQCGMCILQHVIHDHNCQTEKYKTNCPICFEDLFSSRTAIHEMNCGHSIHWDCFQNLALNATDVVAADFSSRCPICKKSIDPDMTPTWNALALAIQMQPIPDQYAQVVTIICNDCSMKCTHRAWHFLGVQCTDCHSFNTSIVETLLTGDAAVAFLRGDRT